MGIGLKRIAIESDWRNETLRTNLWLIPAVESVAAVLLFVLTLSVDHAAFHRELSLPSWVISGSPDAAREILAALAGALITVVGVVFSVMIVTLTLASQQFGPRMLRTFIRDRGAQLTLGTFVATFFYAMLVLISIGSTFVPHLSVTVALALTAVDLGVLIYFIHHTATAIQLPEVIASIARDLTRAIDDECGGAGQPTELANGTSPELLQARLDRGGAVVAAPTSGYLRFVRHATLVAIAAEYDAVIRLHDRPGHFLTRGHPMATVWPPEVADKIRHRLERVHITGPLRTLTQDIAFGIDQLVEIAIRALSPAVNDTFTAMTCIDWLGDSLCRIAVDWYPQVYHRDRSGQIRLIAAPVSYERLVARSFEKIRQASGGMPAVLIRQIDALFTVMEVAPPGRTQVLLDQAVLLQRLSERTVPEQADQADIAVRYQALLALHATRSQAMAQQDESRPGPFGQKGVRFIPGILQLYRVYIERTLVPPGQESARNGRNSRPRAPGRAPSGPQTVSHAASSSANNAAEAHRSASEPVRSASAIVPVTTVPTGNVKLHQVSAKGSPLRAACKVSDAAMTSQAIANPQAGTP